MKNPGTRKRCPANQLGLVKVLQSSSDNCPTTANQVSGSPENKSATKAGIKPEAQILPMQAPLHLF